MVSIGSLWEITIKVGLGKLSMETTLTQLFRTIEENEIGVIPISMNHLIILEQLPLLHRDPFDRLIVAQAVSEGLPIVTADAEITRYQVKTMWQ